MIYKNFYNKYKMSEQIIVQNENEKENQSSDIENGSGVLEENVSVNDLPEVLPEVLAEGGEEVLKPETNENVKEKEVLLKLGDIILISDPTNEILNDNIFLIEYIDPSKIKLINSETFEKIVLPIATDGLIGDGNIKAIKVISSNPENGFARQNELLPGTWVNIYFSGEIPTVITGEITNLEEDMIEIRTIDGDTLYINFNYQGIPENLKISYFQISFSNPLFLCED